MNKMKSDELLNTFLDQTPNIVYFKNIQNEYLKISESAEKHGFDVGKISGKTDFDLYPDNQAEKTSSEDMEVMDSGDTIEKEERITFPSGEQAWISVRKAPQYDENGNIIGMIGILRDISPRKKTKTALEESEKIYRTIFEHSGTNVIIQDGKFVEVNPEFEALTGYSEDELIGRNSLGIVPKEERKEVRENAIQMLKNGRTEPYEHRIETKDGGQRWLLEKVSSMRYEGKKASLASFIDITDRVEETKRKELLQALLRHDLRNKVQVAKGYLLLLKKQEITGDAEEYLQKASRAIKDSINLIERMRGKKKTEEIEITKDEIK